MQDELFVKSFFINVSTVASTYTLILNCNKLWIIFVFEGPDEVVGPEGMEKFCEDIGVEPENVCFIFK